MTAIDLCLRVKPSGSKCSILLHILALALNSLEQICSLYVLSLCSLVCLQYLSNAFACNVFIFTQPSHMQMNSFYFLFSPPFTRLCAWHCPYFIFSQELSVLFFSSSLADSRERICGCCSPSKKSRSSTFKQHFAPPVTNPWLIWRVVSREQEKRGNSSIFFSASSKKRIILKWGEVEIRWWRLNLLDLYQQPFPTLTHRERWS